MKKTRILIVEANPRDTTHLKLNKESAIIENTLDEAKAGNSFKIKKISAATGKDLSDMLWSFKPNIIHFCGHGEKNNLLFVDDDSGKTHEIAKADLIALFEQYAEGIQCALFNTCESAELAAGMVEHIDYAIGMNEPVWDDTSLNFATGFYRGLFKTGEIEKAFQYGLLAVKFANLSEQQHVPVLKMKQKIKEKSSADTSQNFLADYQYDVLIHAASTEKAWTETLIEELKKYLAAKFGSLDAFKVHLQIGEVDFSQAASCLLVLSPAYLSEYSTVLNSVEPILAEKRLFLVEYTALQMPEFLQGVLSFRFWKFESPSGLNLFKSQDSNYSVCLGEMASSLYNFLQQQQKLQASQQRSDAQRLSLSTNDTNSFVFINLAPQDKALADEITKQFEQYGIDYILPLEDDSGLSRSEFQLDLEANFLDCNAVLLLCRHSPIVWLRSQLRYYRKIKPKREHNLKMIAVALYREDKLNMGLAELKIFECEPPEFSAHIADFMEALK